MASVETAANEAEMPPAIATGQGMGSPQGAPVSATSDDPGPLPTWTCLFCTWQNADVPTINVCDACEKPRNASPKVEENAAVEATGGVGMEQKATPWACAECTFWNEPGAEACAMCQVVPGFANVSAPGGAQGPPNDAHGGAPVNKPLSCEACTASTPCQNCLTQLNASLGGQEASAEQGVGQQGQAAAGGDNVEEVHAQHTAGEEGQPPQSAEQGTDKPAQKAPEPVIWSCQVCTFENQEPDVRCQVCTSSKPPQGENPEQVAGASQNMCTLCGLIKPFGQPWKGGLCSQCRPIVEEDLPMDVEALPETEVGQSRSAPPPGPCGVCHKVVPGVLLQTVDGCGHCACCACLASLTLTRMDVAPPALAAAHSDILALLHCWEAGCPRLLSSGSLSCSLPLPNFLALSHWLVTAISSVYPQPTAVTSSSPDRATSQAGVQEAPPAGPTPEFTCGAQGCPSQGVPQAFVSTGEGDPSHVWAVCAACPHMTCLACGAAVGVSLDAEYRDHRFSCPLAQTWDVFRALLAFEEAFRTNEAVGKASADDAEGRSHKKQKTEAAGSGKRRIVWAKGTGFGGGGRDEYEEDAYDDEDEDEEDEDDNEEPFEEDDVDEGEQALAGLGEGSGDEPDDEDDDDDMDDVGEEEEAALLQALLASQAEAGAATQGGEQEQAEGAATGPVSGGGTDAPKESPMGEAAQGTHHSGATGNDGEQHGQLLSASAGGQAADLLAGMSPVTPSVGEAPVKAASPPWAAAGSPPEATAFPGNMLETSPAAEMPASNAEAAPEAATGGTAHTAATGSSAGPVAPQLPTGFHLDLATIPGAVPGPLGGVPDAAPALAAAGMSPLAGMVPPAGLFGLPSGVAGVGPSSDKRKERKDKEEAREEKLRERERQADIRLALAAEALTETLSGDDFAPVPNAATAALVRRSWACRILAAVLARCSLLDVGHCREREQLYLHLLHLVRALGRHSDLLPALLADKDDDDDGPHAKHAGPDPRGAERKRSKGLLGIVLTTISCALAKRRRQDGPSQDMEETARKQPEGGGVSSVMDGLAAAEVVAERGIRPDPALKPERIVLEGGRSVLAALADLNRQARIVQQGLKHGMAEGENEGDFGVAMVGLVLEVSDCYEQASRRAALWDSERRQAGEERDALAALEQSAREAEERAVANESENGRHGGEAANSEDGAETEMSEELVAKEDAPEVEVEDAPAAQTGDQEMAEAERAVGGSGEAAGAISKLGLESSGADQARGKTPLKERVMKGLKGMLISKKNHGKQKEQVAEATPNGEAKREEEELPKTADAGAGRGTGAEGGPSLEARIRAYKAGLKAVQFQEVSLLGEDGQYEHNYRGEVGSAYGEQSGSGAHSAKRQLRMLREIASLATTLPLEWESSVHIRVDTTRMDLLKAAIIGPQDTPYSNGIWLFDVLLPPDYPEMPPRVKFLTTGGGTVRFNPNLYDCGKVCLSLLGTWSGPSWRPGKSTLLQVLISLQSLVFVAEPYYNEPGYEARESSAASEAYNQDVRLNAMRYAILAPLKSPPRAFQDVTQQHFKLKRAELAAQVDDWISRADSKHKEACTQVGAEIMEELAKLGE